MSNDADEPGISEYLENLREAQAVAFEQGARAMAKVCSGMLGRFATASERAGHPAAAVNVAKDAAKGIREMLEHPDFDEGNPYRTETRAEDDGPPLLRVVSPPGDNDMGKKLHWKEVARGDLIRWSGRDVYDPWEQVRRIELDEKPRNFPYIGVILTDTSNGIGLREDTTFEVVRRAFRHEVFGVVLELFEDGSVRVDGERHELLTSTDKQRIP